MERPKRGLSAFDDIERLDQLGEVASDRVSRGLALDVGFRSLWLVVEGVEVLLQMLRPLHLVVRDDQEESRRAERSGMDQRSSRGSSNESRSGLNTCASAHRPFRGSLGVHSRCGPHTRAVTFVHKGKAFPGEHAAIVMKICGDECKAISKRTGWSGGKATKPSNQACWPASSSTPVPDADPRGQEGNAVSLLHLPPPHHWPRVDGGGKKVGGSGRGKLTGHPAAHKGGRIGGAAAAARPPASRSEAAKKAAATRKRNAAQRAPT